MEKFNVETINLSGKNLIEASAGTGKTYSVSIMALRLILEHDIAVGQILMVTFTEAAAAEMAERLMHFIRNAYRKACGNYVPENKNDLIDKIVNNSEDHRIKLGKALMELDEIHVSTIHGFCNKILTEFAFESRQNFNYNIITDDKLIFNDIFNQYWRTELILEKEIELDYNQCYNLLFNLFLENHSIEKEIVYSENKTFFDNTSFILKQQIEDYKQKNCLLTYNDLISKLFMASQDEEISKNLNQLLEEKYKALFIDEFQDTDKNQFEIFNALFKNIPQFYVGDPKQSIYSFRGADIDSYLKVKEREDVRKYEMKVNFRSSENMVNAVNDFYKAQLNPFNVHNISYGKVDANKGITIIKNKQESLPALSIKFENFNVDAAISMTVNRVLYYLNNCYIDNGKTTERVKPKDIAILYRTKLHADKIRKALINRGVPTVTMDGTNIFSSPEAALMTALLNLLINPGRENLIMVLISDFMGYSISETQTIDFSAEIMKIMTIKGDMTTVGIFNSLHQFINNYHKESEVRARYKLSYNRMKSNILQLVDIIHNKVTVDKIGLEMLPDWLTREKDTEAEGGFYEQRLESDESAVKLMTIHKSKGLEFGITIAPFLADKHEEDEFYRVLYVALTRAKYKTDIICSSHGSSTTKMLKSVLSPLLKDQTLANCFSDPNFEIEANDKYNANDDIGKQDLIEYKVKFVDKSWKISSYSALAEHNDFDVINSETVIHDEYDDFVFNKLPKGPASGIFLHSIFEKANFEHKNFSAYLNYSFKGNIKKEHFTGYSKLMEQVLSADFNGFNLLDLPNHLRLNEFEYHLKIKENSSISSITGLFNDKYRSDENISGLLNGFIDMIFEKDGKYYLLDWKSNYLGNTLDAYKRKNLDIAIQSNNYDLQYHLYTVALCSYLKQNIAEFDFDKHFGGGFWVFLRGCRSGEKNGICFFEPDKEKFDSMSKILG